MAMDKKLTLDLKLDAADKNLFSAEELGELEAQARAEIKKDEKARRQKILLEKAKRAVRSEIDPTEEVVKYDMYLPPHALNVTIDGIQYENGVEYEFTRRKLASVQDIVSSAWKHEDLIKGHLNPDAYRREKRNSISYRGR